MSKYIYIEGSDGNGKSSLVEWINKTFNYNIFKEQLLYRDRLNVNYNGYFYYKDLLNNLPDNCVIDRLHIGEAVNPIIRKDGRNPLTLKQIHDIEKPIKNRTLLITCLTDEDVVANTFQTRGEDVAKIEDIKYLAYLYRHFHDLSSIENKIVFDYLKDKNYEKIKTEIESFLKISLQQTVMV